MNNGTPAPDPIETYARAATEAVALPVRDDDWPLLLTNLRTIFSVAGVLFSEPIPDEDPPAPVFHP